MKDLVEKKGTIAHCLAIHQDELSQQITLKGLNNAVFKLLDEDKSLNADDVAQCKQILNSSIRCPNKYYSIVTTYMTGRKVQ